MKIWQKYLLRQFSFTFTFFLLCLFIVYVLIDFSIHGVRFLTSGPKAGALDFIVYYLQYFAQHLDLFLPLTFLLSMYKVLFHLASHFELVALQMAGLSRKKLLLPLFFFASLLSLFGWINHEYFVGNAIVAADEFKASHSKSGKKNRSGDHFQTLVLEDQSELVYQSFDPQKKEFFDVFWIRSEGDFWHIKKLFFASFPPIGYFADHLVRETLLQKQESFEEKIFKEMPLAPTTAPKPFIPFESRPISALFLEARLGGAGVKTHLHHKLALPLLPLLVLLAAAPFTFAFSRQRPTLLIVSLSLFGLIASLTLLDSFLILGENKVFPPALAIWTLPLLIAFFSCKRFAKL